MQLLSGMILLTGFFPLACAWRVLRRTSLSHALVWASLAWLNWGAVLLMAEGGAAVVRYLALCLTGCAGVAVLGARRPGVTAWNFVVGGLLVVLLLSLAEGLLLRGGAVQLGGVRALFLAGTLAVATLNYLPTRFGLAAVFVGGACGLSLYGLLAADRRYDPAADYLIALAPWLAWLAGRRRQERGPVDALWLGFRDRYGFVWGQRLREQFNRSAAHAGLPVELGWGGLRPSVPDATTVAACLGILHALMKRFGPPQEEAESVPPL